MHLVTLQFCDLCVSTFRRDHVIRKSHEEKTVEVEERVEQILRQGQKDLQETRTKHKKELAKVTLSGSISVSGQLRTYPSPNPTCYNKLIS